jgi:hypothetical protein
MKIKKKEEVDSALIERAKSCSIKMSVYELCRFQVKANVAISMFRCLHLLYLGVFLLFPEIFHFLNKGKIRYPILIVAIFLIVLYIIILFKINFKSGMEKMLLGFKKFEKNAYDQFVKGEIDEMITDIEENN